MLAHYENQRYTPRPSITLAVLVIAARRLLMPKTLLLARIDASASRNCE
jgi:hypothetical protein